MTTKNFIVAISILFLLPSCVHYQTLQGEKTGDSKLAIQKYYSPCCGWCGQRVIYDIMQGEQQALLINCKPAGV